jgi:hypothetical protein
MRLNIYAVCMFSVFLSPSLCFRSHEFSQKRIILIDFVYIVSLFIQSMGGGGVKGRKRNLKEPKLVKQLPLYSAYCMA